MDNASFLDRLGRNPFGAALALALLCLIAALPGFFTIPPSDRDESRFAQASKQMLESGDYIDIRFQDEARHKKPAGIYWLQAASASQFGGPEAAPIWAYRIPSLIGAVLASLLTFWAAIPLIGRRGGFLAGAMIASCVLLAVEARIAKTDAMLLACSVAALGGLARARMMALEEPAPPPGWTAPLVFWSVLGFGILLKGPVILGPVLGAILWVAIAGREIGWLRHLRPLIGVPLMLAICTPWFLAITERSGGAFFQASVGEDLGKKLMSGVEAHGGPPGAHLLAFLGTFWPWTGLFLLALPLIWRARKNAATMLLIGWVVPFWLVLEVTPTKLPHYPLPLFPALAMLTASALLSALPEASRPQGWRFRIPAALWMIPAIGLPLAAILAPLVIEGRVLPVAVICGVLALGAAWVAGRALLSWRLSAFMPPAILSALLSYGAVFGAAIPALETGFIAPRLEAALDSCGKGLPVAVIGFSEPSTVFELGTQTRFAAPADAAALLESGHAIWVEDRQAARAFGNGPPVEQARVDGFNYNGGDDITLRLYAASDLECAAAQ